MKIHIYYILNSCVKNIFLFVSSSGLQILNASRYCGKFWITVSNPCKKMLRNLTFPLIILNLRKFIIFWFFLNKPIDSLTPIKWKRNGKILHWKSEVVKSGMASCITPIYQPLLRALSTLPPILHLCPLLLELPASSAAVGKVPKLWEI